MGRDGIGRKAELIDAGKQSLCFGVDFPEPGVLEPQLLGFFPDLLGIVLDPLGIAPDLFGIVLDSLGIVLDLLNPSLDPLSVFPHAQDLDLGLPRARFDFAHGSPIEHR
jgi:hypothetical protein